MMSASSYGAMCGAFISCTEVMPTRAACRRARSRARSRSSRVRSVVQDVPRRVVGVALDHAVAAPAVEVDHAGLVLDQRGRDDRGVTIDPADVGDPSADGAVELGAGEGPSLRPAALVPPMGEEHGSVVRGRVRGQQVEGLGQRGGRAEVDGLQGEAGLGQVHVRVDEARSHEPAVRGR